MAEIKRCVLDVEVNYTCDSGDGGVLIFDGSPSKDEQQEDVFPHRCTDPKDETIYFLKSKYPRVEMALVDIEGIKL